jgi:hypothetical protein
LRHEEKWNEECSLRNQKISGNTRSMGASAPRSNESHHDEDECHTSSKKNAMPIGKKEAKEQQHQGKMSDFPVGKLYMDALENMWAKKKESEELKEKKRM